MMNGGDEERRRGEKREGSKRAEFKGDKARRGNEGKRIY